MHFWSISTTVLLNIQIKQGVLAWIVSVIGARVVYIVGKINGIIVGVEVNGLVVCGGDFTEGKLVISRGEIVGDEVVFIVKL